MSKRRARPDLGEGDALGTLVGRLEILALTGEQAAARIVDLLQTIDRNLQDLEGRSMQDTYGQQLLIRERVKQWTRSLAYAHTNDARRLLASIESEAAGFMRTLGLLSGSNQGTTQNPHILSVDSDDTATESRRTLPLELEAESTLQVWDIELVFENGPRATLVGLLLARLGQGLESIPGVEVQVIDITAGSLRIRLRVTFRTFAQQLQLREILERARKEAFAWYSKVPVEQQEKLGAETQTIREAQDRIKDHVSELDKLSLDVKHEELRRQQLENERQRLQNAGLILENRIKELELVTKASALLKSGLIDADDVRIAINSVLYFEIQKGQLSLKEVGSIDQIEAQAVNTVRDDTPTR